VVAAEVPPVVDAVIDAVVLAAVVIDVLDAGSLVDHGKQAARNWQTSSKVAAASAKD
jgi:hypothetical protein